MNDFSPREPIAEYPPITTARELHARWAELMGDLGFARRQLWFGFLSAAGEMAPVLHSVRDLPRIPEARTLDNVLYLCRDALTDLGFVGGSAAFLLCRPGVDRIQPYDAVWARELVAAASRTGVGLQPTHLASDEAIRVFAADDLVAATEPGSW